MPSHNTVILIKERQKFRVARWGLLPTSTSALCFVLIKCPISETC